MTNGLHRVLLVVSACSVVTLATACLNGTATVVIEDDRSGSIIVDLQATNRVREALREIDLEQLEDAAAARGVELELDDDGPTTTVRLRAEFDDVQLALRVAEQAAASGSSPFQVFSRFELSEPDDGGWRLDAELAPLRLVLAGFAAELGLGAVPLEERASLALNVQLPGRVVSSNAAAVDGSVATWRLTSLDEGLAVQLRTVDDPALTPPVAVALGAGVAIVVGVVLLFAARMRSPASATPIGASGRARRRERRRAVRASCADWSQPAIDEPMADQPVWTVPLPWQDVKPTEADAERARIPKAAEVAPPGAPSPHAVPVPPAPPVAPPAGWYEDPMGTGRHRWWDGAAWTEELR